MSRARVNLLQTATPRLAITCPAILHYRVTRQCGHRTTASTIGSSPLSLPHSRLFSYQQIEDTTRDPQCPLVFHDYGRKIANYYKRWHRACQEAGLVGRIPHDFRRTAVRNMVRAGIPERVAMQMSGHKTRNIFDRYHIVSDGDLREAAKRIESALTAQTTTLQLTLPRS